MDSTFTFSRLFNSSQSIPSISSSSIKYLLTLFLVFSFIESGFAGRTLAREGEYCSTLRNHFIECSDPQAACEGTTFTKYGVCICKSPYVTVHASDDGPRFLRTYCVNGAKAVNELCDDSLQCQAGTINTLCTRMGRKRPACICRIFDAIFFIPKFSGCDPLIDDTFRQAFLIGAVILAFIILFIAVACLIYLFCHNSIADRDQIVPDDLELIKSEESSIDEQEVDRDGFRAPSRNGPFPGSMPERIKLHSGADSVYEDAISRLSHSDQGSPSSRQSTSLQQPSTSTYPLSTPHPRSSPIFEDAKSHASSDSS